MKINSFQDQEKTTESTLIEICREKQFSKWSFIVYAYKRKRKGKMNKAFFLQFNKFIALKLFERIFFSFVISITCIGSQELPSSAPLFSDHENHVYQMLQLPYYANGKSRFVSLIAV